MAALCLLVSVAAGAQVPQAICVPTPEPYSDEAGTLHMVLRPADVPRDVVLPPAAIGALSGVLALVQQRFISPPFLLIGGVRAADAAEPGPPRRPLRSGTDRVGVAVELSFTVHADGQVTGIHIASPSAEPALDSAVLLAMEEAASGAETGGTLHAAARSAGVGNADPVRFTLGVGPVRDSESGSVALSPARFYMYETVRPRGLPRNRPPPYPRSLSHRRVEGDVLVLFEVDVTGRPEPSSIRIHETSAPEFTELVRAYVPLLRYEPGRRGGCPSAATAVENFSFRAPR